MAFETTRRKFMRGLNSRYIYGRVVSKSIRYRGAVRRDNLREKVDQAASSTLKSSIANLYSFQQPLLHAVIFLFEMAITMRLIAKFNSYYSEKPILTTMITNAVLGGIADTVAQSLTAIKSRSKQKSKFGGKQDFMSIEIRELDNEKAESPGELIPTTRSGPPPFDFERLTRFAAYGFMMAPVQYMWFGFLARSFPLAKGRSTIPAMKRVAMDQLVFAPVGLACFFTFMTVAEGGGKRAISHKLQDVYLPALKANYMLWPLVQMLNFRVIPIQFQIPFVSTIGIAWTAYLSLTNDAAEA